MLKSFKFELFDRVSLRVGERYHWVPVCGKPQGYRLNISELKKMVKPLGVIVYRPVSYRFSHLVWLCIDTHVDDINLAKVDQVLKHAKHFSCLDLDDHQFLVFKDQLPDVFNRVDWNFNFMDDDLLRGSCLFDHQLVFFDFNVHTGSLSGPCLDEGAVLALLNQISEHFSD